MADETQKLLPAKTETATAAPGNGAPAPVPEDPEKRRRRFLIIGLVAAVLLVAAILYYLHARNYETTDDAQVDAHLIPINARTDGTIRAVYVEDDAYVKVGQPLVDLDPTDTQVSLTQAQARLDRAQAQREAQSPSLPITELNNTTSVSEQQSAVVNAEASLASAQHDYDNAVAMQQQAEATNIRAQADFQRYKTLFEKNEAAKADYDNYAAIAAGQNAAVTGSRAAVASAQKLIEQRQAQLAEEKSKLEQAQKNAPRQVAIQEANLRSQVANEESAKAEFQQAQLNVGYDHIVAPVAGITTQRSAEIGSHIASGQQLMMIVDIGDLWVTADFKETQLARIHPGQHVKLHVDALDHDFDGTVEAMPAITGSRSSVLPPENATGNYVKVVQRLPMRIRFSPGQSGLEKLRPGMSVEPTVHLD
jgi:membrane fusion protein (multidrug efflux system)